MKLEANAKINLCLDVVCKREDGYHEMDMIMVPLSLHDCLSVALHREDQYVCTNTDMLIDERNTIVKAVTLMRETFGLSQHFSIEVEKHIPMEAGLAGGSADAAAVMKGIWKLCDCPCTLEELAFLGKQIGADVPFCVMNTCALVRGIGEQITPFAQRCKFHVLLVKPTQGVSTKQAFSLLNFQDKTCIHPDTLACKQALEAGDSKRFYAHSGNTLEYSAFQLVPQLQTLKQELYDLGFPFVLMSGSGSTMFALSENLATIQKGYEEMKSRYPFVFHTNIIERSV